MTAGFVVTARDREIIHWLGRVKIATFDQLRVRFPMPQSGMYKRLAGLRKLGLIQRTTKLGRSVFYTTSKGLKAVDLDLHQPNVKVVTFNHDLEATNTVITLENQGTTVLTEREIRQAHRVAGENLYTVEVKEPGRTYPSNHTPDLIVLGRHGEWVAVEVELTAKAAGRVKAILEGYNYSPKECLGVLYLTPTEREKQRLKEFAEEVWLKDEFAAAHKDKPAEIHETLRRLINTRLQTQAP